MTTTRTPRELRIACGLTLDALAKETGIDRPALSRGERGYQQFSDPKVERWAAALGVRPSKMKASLDLVWASPPSPR